MKTRKGLGIGARIYSIIVVSVLASGAVAFTMYDISVKNIYKMREAHLRDVVDTTVSMVAALHGKAESGELTETKAKAEAVAALNSIRYDDGNYVFAFDKDLMQVAHGRSPDAIGTFKGDSTDPNGVYTYRELLKTGNEGGGLVYYSTQRSDDSTKLLRKMSYVRPFKPWGWYVATGSYIQDIEDQIAKMRMRAAVAFLIGVVCLVAVSTIISRSVTGPINGLNRRMQALSSGDADTQIPHTDKGDEIGEMARSVEAFRQDIQRGAELERSATRHKQEQEAAIAALGKGLTALSHGDLSIHLDEAFPADYEALRRDFNGTVDNLSELVGTISETSTSLQNRGEAITRSAEVVATRSIESAASLEEAAAAIEELTSSVKLAAKGAQEADTIATEARNNAEQSGEVVRRAVVAMGAIEESSGKISRIMDVIDDIAFQTNLLALNAGVEAARAGEAGRGFAVVASEVRALAQRSSEAAREINVLITESGGHVSEGVSLVDAAGESLGQISGSVAKIASHISDIATSANEQSAGVSEINTSVAHLDRTTQENSSKFQDTLEASRALTHEAQNLRQIVGRFTLRGGSGMGKVTPFAQASRPAPSAPVAQKAKAVVNAPAPAASDDSWEDF